MSKTLAGKIKAIRKQEGLSQEGMAESLGYTSKTTVSKLESDSVEMTFDQLSRLIGEYDLDAGSLFPLGRIDERLHKGCAICTRIKAIIEDRNPHFVKELKTGYVLVGDHCRFPGYAVFICKSHVNDLHELPFFKRTRFLTELSLVEEAVYEAYKPDKMNVEILGNGDPHLHVHFFPRFAGDTPEKGPVWWVPKQEMYAKEYLLEGKRLNEAVMKLRSSLDQVLSKHYWLLPDFDDYEKEDERYQQRLKRMLGKRVEVKVDRPLGSAHPLHPGIVYPVNYGHIEPMLAPDGDYQDAYVLGINKAVPSFSGVVIAVIRRLDDIEGKLVVAPEGVDYSDEEILKEVAFQERYFESVLLR